MPEQFLPAFCRGVGAASGQPAKDSLPHTSRQQPVVHYIVSALPGGAIRLGDPVGQDHFRLTVSPPAGPHQWEELRIGSITTDWGRRSGGYSHVSRREVPAWQAAQAAILDSHLPEAGPSKQVHPRGFSFG